MNNNRILFVMFLAVLVAVTGIHMRAKSNNGNIGALLQDRTAKTVDYKLNSVNGSLSIDNNEIENQNESNVNTENVIGVKTAEAETPSEAIKNKIINTKPIGIDIPSIGISAPIIPVGITADGIMDTPHNFREAGWYELGTLPGMEGSAVIDAHVDNGASIPGPFKKLKYAKNGDIVTITMSNGVKLDFVVTESTVYNYKNVDTGKLFNESGSSMIKLITCHGKWLQSERTYDQRIVVTARLK